MTRGHGEVAATCARSNFLPSTCRQPVVLQGRFVVDARRGFTHGYPPVRLTLASAAWSYLSVSTSSVLFFSISSPDQARRDTIQPDSTRNIPSRTRSSPTRVPSPPESSMPPLAPEYVETPSVSKHGRGIATGAAGMKRRLFVSSSPMAEGEPLACLSTLFPKARVESAGLSASVSTSVPRESEDQENTDVLLNHSRMGLVANAWRPSSSWCVAWGT